MTLQIKILLADDHQIFLDGLELILLTQNNIEVIGRANTGDEVLLVLKDNQVDIVLLDIDMPILNGIEVLKRINSIHKDTKVIILSMHNSFEYISQAISVGANGYILKNTGKDELILAIKKVFDGEEYYSKGITDIVFAAMKQGGDILFKVELSKREIEVIRLIAKGFTTRDISKTLFITENTVETHRRNILSKTNSRNSAELINYARNKKLLND